MVDLLGSDCVPEYLSKVHLIPETEKRNPYFSRKNGCLIPESAAGADNAIDPFGG